MNDILINANQGVFINKIARVFHKSKTMELPLLENITQPTHYIKSIRRIIIPTVIIRGC